MIELFLMSWICLNVLLGCQSIRRGGVALKMTPLVGVLLGGGIAAFFSDFFWERKQKRTASVSAREREEAMDRTRAALAAANSANRASLANLQARLGQGSMGGFATMKGQVFTSWTFDTAGEPTPLPPLEVSELPPLEVSESREVIVGYRLWEIRPAGRQAFLESVTTRTVWPVGEPCEAHMLTQHIIIGWPSGIHAFKTAHTRSEYEENYGIKDTTAPIAFGKVALWGRVVEHAHGYRAQYAYPLSLVVLASTPNAENLARALANTYGCEARVEKD